MFTDANYSILRQFKTKIKIKSDRTIKASTVYVMIPLI